MRVGGIDEVQTINFINTWTGTFRLAFDHDGNPDTPDQVTAPITYNGNSAATAYAIQAALAGSA